jgi:hypothetical protein
MLRGVQRAPHGGDVREHAGRRFVVGGENRLDAAVLVGAQDLLEPRRGDAFAPRRFHDLDGESMALAHVDPAMGEHAVARRENRVAGRQRVGDRHLPAAGARGREDEHLGRFGAQDLPDTLSRGLQDVREGRRPMIDRGHVAGPAKRLGHIGGAGYENRVLEAHCRLLPWIGTTSRPPVGVVHNFFENVFQKWYDCEKNKTCN